MVEGLRVALPARVGFCVTDRLDSGDCRRSDGFGAGLHNSHSDKLHVPKLQCDNAVWRTWSFDELWVWRIRIVGDIAARIVERFRRVWSCYTSSMI